MAIYAGTWTLNQATQAPAESSWGLDDDGSESVWPDDSRTVVPPKEFAPGGKYRCELELPVNMTDTC